MQGCHSATDGLAVMAFFVRVRTLMPDGSLQQRAGKVRGVLGKPSAGAAACPALRIDAA